MPCGLNLPGIVSLIDVSAEKFPSSRCVENIATAKDSVNDELSAIR